MSGNRAGQGAIRAVNVRSHTVAPLFPSPSLKTRPDAAKFPGCPGPIDSADSTEKARFAAHGLYLAKGAATSHVLYVVHHGSRESIEVFDVDARSTPPTLTWTGCIVGPPNGTFNAVVALPEGGVAATVVTRTGGQPASPNGSGAVWEWHPGRSWTMVPGSEADRINGLEISPDGKWLYVSAWGDQALIRLQRGQVPAKRDVLQMPFRIDNLRWTSNGSILAAGHGGNALCSCPDETWHVGRIDPNAMTVQEILRRPLHRRVRRSDRGARSGEGDLDRHESRRPHRPLPGYRPVTLRAAWVDAGLGPKHRTANTELGAAKRAAGNIGYWRGLRARNGAQGGGRQRRFGERCRAVSYHLRPMLQTAAEESSPRSQGERQGR